MLETETLILDPSGESGPFFLIVISISAVVSTGVFLWGLFGKKPDAAKKIVLIETVILFIAMMTYASLWGLADFRFLEKFGAKTEGVVGNMINYFSRCLLVGSVSLYQLILFCILLFRKNRKL